jgi:translation initiation factor IF-3
LTEIVGEEPTARIECTSWGVPDFQEFFRNWHSGRRASLPLAVSQSFSRRTTIRFFDPQPTPVRGPRINEQIRISPIRLIGAEGEQLGLVPTIQALEKAREAGLDLVEVAADERPPVCRILDYGKMRFANSQKGNKTSKVRQRKLKEIRLRPRTGDHDVDTKAAHARKFLKHNDRVQVTVLFRGREMQHVEEGRRVLDAILQKLTGVSKVERPPLMDGKKMTVLLMPIKAASKPRVKARAAILKPPQDRAESPRGEAKALDRKSVESDRKAGESTTVTSDKSKEKGGA